MFLFGICVEAWRLRLLLMMPQIEGFLKELCFETLPLSERIGYRASIYVEEYALSHGTGVADALVAATAVEENRVLLSGNIKHFKCIKDLQLTTFRASL